ncbi:hypothetical protein PV326_008846 [Microctonus aethiopoides]|nr:hypothetical protein PV326_008846 [Microctonus aethiopoides]
MSLNLPGKITSIAKPSYHTMHKLEPLDQSLNTRLQENQPTSKPLLSPYWLPDSTTSTSAQSTILPNFNSQQQQQERHLYLFNNLDFQFLLPIL